MDFHVQLPPMRPKFEFTFPILPAHAIELLQGIMDNNDHPIEGRVAGNHLMLVIPIKDRHFWSPWLNLEARTHRAHDSDDTITHIKGRFSPNPSVWTGYMMTYSSLAVLAFLTVMFGVSQAIMGSSPWTFQFLIPILFIAGVMYWSSLVGQKLAHDQMQLLYRVTLETLADGSGIKVLDHPTEAIDSHQSDHPIPEITLINADSSVRETNPDPVP
jgi:hypothetical protein